MRRRLILLIGFLLLPVALWADGAFEIVQVAEGVYAALVRSHPPMYVFANALIVIDDEGVVVVDSHASPSAARALLARLARLTDKPVRFVINTHGHGDHVYGNQVYREAFPGVEFVGHHTTRADVNGLGVARLQQELEELPGSIEDRKKWAATGIGPDGEKLTEEQISRVRRSQHLREGQLAELRELELIAPTLTFERSLSLHWSHHTIRVLHFGRAHTRGDVVVYLPEAKLLAAGDLVEEGFPYVDESYLFGWAAALQALTELEVGALLPSHGGLHRDRELLLVERDFFTSLTQRVQQAVQAGASLAETQESVRLDEFREPFTGHDPARAPAFERFVMGAVERAYREGVGELDD